ncbi:MAG: DUF6326 family protein [Candidatus Bathyarchaeota archaeon]
METAKIDVRIKLSALWIAEMFCYLFAAVWDNYKPGVLEALILGEIDGIAITQGVLFGNAVMMVIPSVMVFMSLVLKDKVNRLANIILSIFFMGIILVTYAFYYVSGINTWAYSYVFTITEIILYALIVGYAWKWPRY